MNVSCHTTACDPTLVAIFLRAILICRRLGLGTPGRDACPRARVDTWRDAHTLTADTPSPFNT
eukprot:5457-Rhodomonas_salina.10